MANCTSCGKYCGAKPVARCAHCPSTETPPQGNASPHFTSVLRQKETTTQKTDVESAYTGYANQQPQSPRSGLAPEWDWRQPVWPRRQDVDEEISSLESPPLDSEQTEKFRRAFRSIYRQKWFDRFSKPNPDRPTHIMPNRPENDSQGWQWRKEVLDSTREAFAGAHIEKVANIKPGMALYDGHGVRVVTGTMTFLNAEGQPKARAMWFLGGQGDSHVPPAREVVRLPKLDKEIKRPRETVVPYKGKTTPA